MNLLLPDVPLLNNSESTTPRSASLYTAKVELAGPPPWLLAILSKMRARTRTPPWRTWRRSDTWYTQVWRIILVLWGSMRNGWRSNGPKTSNEGRRWSENLLKTSSNRWGIHSSIELFEFWILKVQRKAIKIFAKIGKRNLVSFCSITSPVMVEREQQTSHLVMHKHMHRKALDRVWHRKSAQDPKARVWMHRNLKKSSANGMCQVAMAYYEVHLKDATWGKGIWCTGTSSSFWYAIAIGYV